MMKMFGIVIASVAAVLLGARLTLLAFDPVLPPDFERKWDEDFAIAYRLAEWRSGWILDYQAQNDAWPRTPEEALTTSLYADLKETNPRAWQSSVDEFEREVRFIEVDDEVSVMEYVSMELHHDAGDRPTRWLPNRRVRCTVTLDRAFARAYTEWFSTPGARASSQVPEEVSLWPRMDCRRQVGPRAWLSWTGIDRYRRPPPERYAALDYAQDAWERGGIPAGPLR